MEFALKPGQTIYSEAGSMSYIREGVERGKASVREWSGLIPRLFAGQNGLFAKYTGLANNDPLTRLVAFSAALPGDFLTIEMEPHENIIVNRGSYVASSDGIEVEAKLNLRGLINFGQEEGYVLPKLRCGDRPGTAWISAYGFFREHRLKAGEKLGVNNGLFLACRRPHSPGNSMDNMYTLELMGKTVASSILGGEGLGMAFEGPCIVYTQSHNLNDLLATMEDHIRIITVVFI